jgi:glycosyltransferase involved in cell wall biosynthesis
MKKRKRMLFDGTQLANASCKNPGRSGIYFVAFNIFKKFVDSNKFEISLYCQSAKKNDLELFLNKYYPDKKFKIVSDKPISSKKVIYDELKKLRKLCKDKKEYFWKFIFQVQMIFFAISIFFEKILSKFELKIESNFDVYFSPVYCVPERYRKITKMKKYIILHDVIPTKLPEYKQGRASGTWYDKLTKSLNNNDFYFSNSEYTRQDFLKYFPVIDENKIFTTLLACDESFQHCTGEDSISSKEKYNIPLDKKYVFSLCTLEPRKNLVRAVKTFIEFIKKNNIEDMIFVLGGYVKQDFIVVLEKEVSDFDKYQDKILKIGYVDDEDLAPLYSGASWFVYTSMYEGFGLPLLEAMSCGCPIIASKSTSLPEVVGDAGIKVDWDSDEQHIQAYEKYYYDEEFRIANIQKSLERASFFSWDKCATKMIDIIEG